jgi:hypothetical protein
LAPRLAASRVNVVGVETIDDLGKSVLYDQKFHGYGPTRVYRAMGASARRGGGSLDRRASQSTPHL